MRDGLCEAFEAFISIFFFEYLTLEAYLVNMLSHNCQVDCNGRAIQVLYLLGPYHHVLLHEFCWFCIVINLT